MEKKTVNEIIKPLFYKCINFVLSVLVAFGIVAIVELHFMVPFFPILVFFDFCLIIGYPLLLVKVLNKEWFKCCKDKFLQIQYILLPTLFLEGLTVLVVITYYSNEILKSS